MYLQGRLFAAPVADVIPLDKPYTEQPAPVEPVKQLWLVNSREGGHHCDSAEEAYTLAEKMAIEYPTSEVYVSQVRAKITGSVTVNRTDY